MDQGVALPVWPDPPESLALEPGWVHVFSFRLELAGERLEALRRSLSADEQARAARYLREPDGRHFIAARGQLREILSAYTGIPPAGLRFTYTPQGKPALAEDAPRLAGELRFNLSHSAGLGLLAVAAGREVGVDLEWSGREVDDAAISTRFFAPGEIATLRALPEPDRRQGFFNAWTRKEAYLKATGLGLALPLDSFSVSLVPGDPPRLDAPQGGWSLYALDPAPGYTAALAVAEPVDGVRCWRWARG